MNSATAIFFTLLLVASLPAMAATTAGSGTGSEGDGALNVDDAPQQNATPSAPVEVENTTNRLQLEGEIRSEHTHHSNDLGTVLASGDDELRFDQERYALIDSEFDNASTEERIEMVQAAYAHLRDRADELEDRERTVVREHAEGDRSTTELVQILIRSHSEASILSSTLDYLVDRTDRIPGYSIPTQEANAVDKTLDFHQTPIRSDLESTMRTNQRTKLLVQTSESGYSVATVDGRTYVVETTRFDHRDTDEQDQFANIEHISDALDRAMQFYPWAEAHGSPSFHDRSHENLYWLDVGHTQGTLEAYIDGGTESVHREIQELSVAALPVTDETTWTDGDLELSIRETPANGPAEASIVGSDGEPRNATVSINGTEIGETGDDGSLWILPPADEYDVDVTTDDGSVEATVSSDAD